MLEDKEVIHVARYWASRYACGEFPFDELYVEGFRIGKMLDNPRMLQCKIKFGIIQFMRDFKCIKGLRVDNLPHSITPCVRDKDLQNVDAIDTVNDLMSKANLTPIEKAILHKKFYLGKKNPNIAEELGVVRATISWHLLKLYSRFRKILQEGENDYDKCGRKVQC